MSNLKSLIIVFPLLLISCGGGGSGSNDSDAALKVVSINFSSNLNEIFIHNKITLTWASIYHQAIPLQAFDECLPFFSFFAQRLDKH